MTYLNDKNFYMIEREVEILRHLFDLENSCIDNKDKIEIPNEEKPNEDYSLRQYKFLKLNYSFEKLDLLSTWIYNSIQDECGNYFLLNRSNFLYDICILIYKKYLKNFLERIDYFISFKEELETNIVQEISQVIDSLQSQIFNTLFCIHYVLTNIPHKDVIIYGYISLLLGDYAEKTGNNATGVVVLKDTLDFIEKTKEKENIFGIDNRENKQTFTCFTCDNNKIFKLKGEIDAKYDEYVKKINKKRRVNYRLITEQGISKADPDIINEEDFEVNYMENEYNNYLDKKEKEKELSKEKEEQPKPKYITKKIKDILPYTHVGFDGEEPKENNQDNYFIYKNFMDRKDYIYMSVCDGHGIEGHFVSDFMKEILPYDMSENLKDCNLMTENEKERDKIHQIIKETFIIANEKLVDNEEINSLFSGSTCVSVIYTPEKLIVPNIGDSRAVLGRLINKEKNEYKAINLSRDHKPTEKDEAKRIIENDGRIQPFTEEGEFVGPERVWIKEEEVPGLAMTRSFGDRVAATVGVMSEPEIKEFLFEEGDKFMIIASDGIWEFISSQECVDIIKNFYDNNDLKGCCEYLYQESSKRWLKEEEVIDDTTLILVFFE